MMLPSEALNREFVVDERALPSSAPGTDEASITTHAVRVGDIGLLLPAGEVSELVDGLPVCKLPNTPTWFSGVTSLRGNIIPVFDMHELFGAALASARRRVIVIGSGQTAAGFWVDGMPAMVALGSDDEMTGDPPLPDFLKNHASRYFLKDNQIWVEWKVQRFFTALGELL